MLQTKKIKTILASMLVVLATGFYSCSSDDGEPETHPGDEKNIIGKWEVTNPETRAAGDAKYGSFEFTADNKYIITQPAVATNGDKYMLVIFGDYVVGKNESNDFTLNLKEFGTIKISITENYASITIDGVVYVAVKSKDMDLSDNNKKFIGTWKVKSKYEDELEFDDAGTMTFTSSGTYLGMFIDGDTGELKPDNGTWYWKSDNVINVSITSYWESSTSHYDPITGEYIPGKTESGVEIEFEDWKIIELTDTKFVAEIDDEGDMLTIIGTK